VAFKYTIFLKETLIWRKSKNGLIKEKGFLVVDNCCWGSWSLNTKLLGKSLRKKILLNESKPKNFKFSQSGV